MRRAPPYAPPSHPLDVLHYDNDVLVLNKPSGLLSTPGRGEHLADCLESRAAHEFSGARIVHRLDMDTSGVMVLARTSDAHRHLSAQFEARNTDKRYIAWVDGITEQRSGAVEASLICDWPNRPLQKVDPEQGKPALTQWRRCEAGLTDGNRSLIALHPITGRSHQLRVHMAHIGHPILGDPFYAPEPVFKVAPRLMLHALELSFDHPSNDTRLTLRAPVPAVFQTFCADDLDHLVLEASD